MTSQNTLYISEREVFKNESFFVTGVHYVDRADKIER